MRLADFDSGCNPKPSASPSCNRDFRRVRADVDHRNAARAIRRNTVA